MRSILRCQSDIERIVSLAPNWTEVQFAFGAADRIAGVTDDCIHPAEGVAAKTKIGGIKNPRVDQVLRLASDLITANVEENKVGLRGGSARSFGFCHRA